MVVKLELNKSYEDGRKSIWKMITLVGAGEYHSYFVGEHLEGNTPFVELFKVSDGSRKNNTNIRDHLVKEYKEPRFVYTSWRTYSHLLNVVSQTYSTEKEARAHTDTVALVKINLNTFEVTPLKI